MALPKLNETQKAALLIELEAELYRRSFFEFFKAASKVLHPNVDWLYPPFYQYICDTLQVAIERVINKEEKDKDFIFNLPFRAGKSILLSQLFPVWCWIKDPSLSIMQISHSELLAVKHSHLSKILIESEWFKTRFPGITLRQDQHAKGNYMNDKGGKRVSFGITSGIIGEGADIQIVDDINNPKDSQAVTQSINETYTDTLYSRLNNPGIGLRIILQQRVAQNDICGYLLDTNPDKYTSVVLPVRMSANISPIDAVQFYSNGLLWPGRFSEKVIQDFQSTLGSRAFAGQLMQSPVSESGNIIKRAWVKIISRHEFQALFDKEKPDVKLFVDTAYTAKQENDASAISVVTKINNNVYIIKSLKVWEEFPDMIKTLKSVSKEHKATIIYIESKASGLSIKQQLQRDGFNVGDLSPKDKDKVTRVNAVAPSIEGGHLWLVEDNSNEMVLSELASFPYGHDDLTDTIVYSIENLINTSGFNYSFL